MPTGLRPISELTPKGKAFACKHSITGQLFLGTQLTNQLPFVHWNLHLLKPCQFIFPFIYLLTISDTDQYYSMKKHLLLSNVGLVMSLLKPGGEKDWGITCLLQK
jgi:hypothetical protein